MTNQNNAAANQNSTRPSTRHSVRNLPLRLDVAHAESQSMAAAKRMARLVGQLKTGKA